MSGKIKLSFFFYKVAGADPDGGGWGGPASRFLGGRGGREGRLLSFLTAWGI